MSIVDELLGQYFANARHDPVSESLRQGLGRYMQIDYMRPLAVGGIDNLTPLLADDGNSAIGCHPGAFEQARLRVEDVLEQALAPLVENLTVGEAAERMPPHAQQVLSEGFKRSAAASIPGWSGFSNQQRQIVREMFYESPLKEIKSILHAAARHMSPEQRRNTITSYEMILMCLATELKEGTEGKPHALPQAALEKLFLPHGIPAAADDMLVAGNTSLNIVAAAIQSCCRVGKRIVLVPEVHFDGFDITPALEGAEISLIPTRAENGYKLTPEALAHAIATVGRAAIGALILTNPNPPANTLYSREELEALAVIIRATGIRVISDEIMAGTEHEPGSFVSLASLPDMYKRVLTVTSLSKLQNFEGSLGALEVQLGDDAEAYKIIGLSHFNAALACTGDRLWAASMERILHERGHALTTHHAAAAEAVLTHTPEGFLQENRNRYRANLEHFTALLEGTGVQFVTQPQAGFFALLTYAPELLQKAGIASSEELMEYLALVGGIRTGLVLDRTGDTLAVRINFSDAALIQPLAERLAATGQMMPKLPYAAVAYSIAEQIEQLNRNNAPDTGRSGRGL